MGEDIEQLFWGRRKDTDSVQASHRLRERIKVAGISLLIVGGLAVAGFLGSIGESDSNPSDQGAKSALPSTRGTSPEVEPPPTDRHEVTPEELGLMTNKNWDRFKREGYQFYENYSVSNPDAVGKEAKDELVEEMKNVLKETRARDIMVGNLYDREERRPFTHEQMLHHLAKNHDFSTGIYILPHSVSTA
jgi:hypothetical protein